MNERNGFRARQGATLPLQRFLLGCSREVMTISKKLDPLLEDATHETDTATVQTSRSRLAPCAC